MRRMGKFLHVALLVGLLAGAARAEDPKRAKVLYLEGMKRYNVGDYAEALKYFKDGYLAKSDPAFLFNMGQCQRQLGDVAAAARSYRAYLRERPDAPNRADVQHFIELAEHPPTGTEPPMHALEHHAEPAVASAPPVKAAAATRAAEPPVKASEPATSEPAPEPAASGAPPAPSDLVPVDDNPSPEAPTGLSRRGWIAIAIASAAVVAGIVTAVLVLTLRDTDIPMTSLGNTAIHF